MPGPSSGRVCPICDSPIEKGDKKCSFCGTDLSIFEVEIEEAFKEEERLVEETFSELMGESKAEPIVEKPAPEKEVIEPVIEEKPEPEEKPPAEESEVAFECPACGGAVSESDNVCPHCKAIFSEEEAQFECPACNSLVGADAVRCPGCGALFIEDEEAAVEEEERISAMAGAPEVAESMPEVIPPEAEAVEPEAAEEAEGEAIEEEAPKKMGLLKGFGFLKGLISREAEPEKKPAPPEKAVPTIPEKKEKPKEISKKREAAAPTSPQAEAAKPGVAKAEVSIAKPAIKREIPKDPKEQGKELARLVAEVRSLLGIARERDIAIDESEQLIDQAIMAGRERQFVHALELVSESEQKLHSQFNDYLQLLLRSLDEEIEVAKKLGGNPSRAKVYIKEANRATHAKDFQAALVFANKAEGELKPMTGRYNETKEAIQSLRKLIRDARVIGIERESSTKVMEEAVNSFKSLDFENADRLIKSTREDIFGQIPEKMNDEIEKAKQLLIEAKIRTEKSISPQITILKSVRWAMKEEKYADALAEMRRFKKEIKELLS